MQKWLAPQRVDVIIYIFDDGSELTITRGNKMVKSRSAKSGKYVTEKFADHNPDTTIKERRRKKNKKKQVS